VIIILKLNRFLVIGVDYKMNFVRGRVQLFRICNPKVFVIGFKIQKLSEFGICNPEQRVKEIED
jgi:hypothetical protein